jgi:RraA family protein
MALALTLKEPPERRLPDEEIAAWAEIPTAIISDDLDRSHTMQAAIKPLNPGSSFAGQALTVRTMVGDNSPLHYALTTAWPGCVVVVDARGHEDTAVWGGILTAAAEARGVRALVVDGAVRDAAELRESKLAVYARAIVPNGPHKGFGGAVNIPIHCAGVAVNPGDLVVGDDDGVVVVPPERREGLIGRCRARIAKEETILEKIAAGRSTVELLGLPPIDEVT